MHVDQNCLKILGKLGKVIKLWTKAFHKTRERLFLGNSQLVFGQFSGNLKINGKPWENDFGLVSSNNFFADNCQQIVSESSEYFRFCHKISYLLTGLLVPYREILNARFLRTDLASSVRTSKPRASA